MVLAACAREGDARRVVLACVGGSPPACAPRGLSRQVALDAAAMAMGMRRAAFSESFRRG